MVSDQNLKEQALQDYLKQDGSVRYWIKQEVRKELA
jgi:hypothetical protein